VFVALLYYNCAKVCIILDELLSDFAVQGSPGRRGPKGDSGEQGRPGSRVINFSITHFLLK